MRTLKQEILELPPKERDARRAFYSDDEWENSWELNAFPFQIEPVFEDWTVWTILAPPRQGKTFAGEHWAWEKHMEQGSNVLCIFRDRIAIEPSRDNFMRMASHPISERKTSYGKILSSLHTDSTLICTSEATVRDGGIRGLNIHYVWADEIRDATPIVRELSPTVKKFLFTQPLKLCKDTVISRAGDSRTLV